MTLGILFNKGIFVSGSIGIGCDITHDVVDPYGKIGVTSAEVGQRRKYGPSSQSERRRGPVRRSQKERKNVTGEGIVTGDAGIGKLISSLRDALIKDCNTAVIENMRPVALGFETAVLLQRA